MDDGSDHNRYWRSIVWLIRLVYVQLSLVSASYPEAVRFLVKNMGSLCAKPKAKALHINPRPAHKLPILHIKSKKAKTGFL